MGGQRGKRQSYRIDPETAHRRSVIGGKSRTTTDYHVRKITEAAGTLTDEQKLQLAALLMPFLTGDDHKPAGVR